MRSDDCNNLTLQRVFNPFKGADLKGGKFINGKNGDFQRENGKITNNPAQFKRWK